MAGTVGHAVRAFWRCWWAQTGHRSGSRIRRSLQEARDHRVLAIGLYDLLASGEWWDTVLADSDRWGARKFTIGPFYGSRLVRNPGRIPWGKCAVSRARGCSPPPVTVCEKASLTVHIGYSKV